MVAVNQDPLGGILATFDGLSDLVDRTVISPKPPRFAKLWEGLWPFAASLSMILAWLGLRVRFVEAAFAFVSFQTFRARWAKRPLLDRVIIAATGSAVALVPAALSRIQKN